MPDIRIIGDTAYKAFQKQVVLVTSNGSYDKKEGGINITFYDVKKPIDIANLPIENGNIDIKNCDNVDLSKVILMKGTIKTENSFVKMPSNLKNITKLKIE